MGEITDSVSALEESQRSLDRELAATRRILSEAVGAAGLGMTSAYAVRAAERIKTLEAKLAEKVDAGNEDYLRYFKCLNTIDEMLKDAFPGDIATIEARVAAACANTKALSDAQFRLEDTERARASLYDQLNSVEEARVALASQLDRERRLHGECTRDLLKAKKDRDYSRGTTDAQRVRADEAEERATKAEKDANYWEGWAKDNGTAFDRAVRERDSLQNKLNGANDDLAHERSERQRLTEEVESLRREHPDIREAALGGKPFMVAGKKYVPEVLPEWICDRAGRGESFWVNGLLYAPVNNDDVLRLKQIGILAEKGKDFYVEGKRYTRATPAEEARIRVLQEKLEKIVRIVETQ